MPQYLLTRQALLSPGQTVKSREWAQNVTEKVGTVTGLPVRLYQQVFSPEVGGLQWHVFVPNISTLESLLDKIQQDDSTIKLIDGGAEFLTARTGLAVGAINDTLSAIIHGNVEQHGAQDARGGPQYQTVVHTVMQSGQYEQAMQLGPNIAKAAEKITSSPTLFAVDQTGVYGGARFITSYQDAKQMENAQQRLMENREWLQFLDQEAAGVFAEQPFSSRQEIYRRLLT